MPLNSILTFISKDFAVIDIKLFIHKDRLRLRPNDETYFCDGRQKIWTLGQVRPWADFQGLLTWNITAFIHMIWMFFVNVDQKFVDAEVFLAAFGKQSLIEQCEKIWLSSLEKIPEISFSIVNAGGESSWTVVAMSG